MQTSERDMSRLTEKEFIEQKKEELKLAIRQTLDRIKENAGNTAEVGPWVDQYPWASVGTAFAAGLLASSQILPELMKGLKPEPVSGPQQPFVAFQNTPKQPPLILTTLSSVLTGTAVALMRDLLERHVQPPLPPNA